MSTNPVNRTAVCPNETNAGSSYTDDEFEFLKAVDRYKRERRRPYPTCCEILGIVRSLGYRRPELSPATNEGLSVITPTVGRVVWFYPAGRNPNDQPLAAIVAAVWGDRCVNLAVFAANGVPVSHPPTSVRLVQPGDEVPGTGTPYCAWMPFQVGQQARAEAAEKALAAR